MENLTVRLREEEAIRKLTESIRHTYRVEWTLHQLGIYNSDPQRPHDSEGEGNKLDPNIATRLALEYRLPKTRDLVPGTPDYILFNELVKPAILDHQKNQHHHRVWEGSILEAKDDDMRIGAVDTIIAMAYEDRSYQKRFSVEEVEREFVKDPRKERWIKEMLGRFDQINLDPLNLIDSLEIQKIRRLAQFGLPVEVCDRIAEKLDQAIENLREHPEYLVKQLEI